MVDLNGKICLYFINRCLCREIFSLKGRKICSFQLAIKGVQLEKKSFQLEKKSFELANFGLILTFTIIRSQQGYVLI